MTRVHLATTLTLSLAAATSASAGPPDPGGIDPQGRAQAQVLFQEGSDLLDADRAAEACPKLQAAVDLAGAEALGGKLVLARCYERLGLTASAWGLYTEVATRAGSAGQAQAERAAEARARAAELHPRLHHLDLTVDADLLSDSTLQIAIDGRPQPRASIGARLPIDAGEHIVTLSISGHAPREDRVVIPAGPGVTKLVLTKPGAVGGASAPAPQDKGGFWSDVRIAGFALGVGGVLGIGVGATLGAVAKSRYDDGLTTGNCAGSPPLCDDASALDDARALGDVGTAVFFAGASVATVGLIMFVVAPTDQGAGGAISVSVAPGPSAISATVRF